MIDKSQVGTRFSDVAKNPRSNHTYEVYKAHTPTITKAIETNYCAGQNIACTDLGGGSGALIKDIQAALPKHRFSFTNIDGDENLLVQDKTSKYKICSDITHRKSIEEIMEKTGQQDLVLMRYVLQYNDLTAQKELLKNSYNLLKKNGIFIMQHSGAHDKKHQELIRQCFIEGRVSEKLIRKNCYFPTMNEVSDMLTDAGFTAKVLDRYLVPTGDLFTSRYRLTKEEDKRLHKHFGNYDFFNYTIYECRK